jgi:predicted PurR-regulated permease PerM
MPDYVPRLSEGARRWLRFGALVVALGLLCWVAYGVRSVLTPLLAAAAIAYVLNPVVTWFEQRRRVPRLATVIVTFALLGALVLGGGLYVGSRTVTQMAELEERVPTYVQTISDWVANVQARLHRSPATLAPTSTAPAEDQPWPKWIAPLLEQHGVALARAALDSLGTTFANLANLISVLVLIPVFTFYFLWRFNDLVRIVHDHLPQTYRPEIVRVATTIDAATASFFRGRLIVCLLVGVLLAIGWSLVGVPYGLLLGILTAILNLVPYLALLGLPPALLFAFLAANQAGTPWLGPVALTMAVYMAVQALEAFLLNPVIAGRTSGLHPLVIVVALLIGGQLAGLLGLLLAIPVASTLRTLAAQWVLPELRRLAGHPGAFDAGGPTSPV